MSTHHDILAFAVATEVVRRVVRGASPWNSILSTSAYVTSSRAWPVPDFVIVDDAGVTVAGEFKPPQQTKREYLTGLGQAIAYTRDFDYGLLVLPEIADDGYPIAKHVVSVLEESAWTHGPVGVISYDPKTFSPSSSHVEERHFFVKRTARPTTPASLDASFYAKWREMSLEEMFVLLRYSYDEAREPSSTSGTLRDRAFDRLWSDIQAGKLHHSGGGIRNYKDTPSMKTGVSKNYRNFLFHIGWTEADGSLTKDGLDALHIGTLYGSASRPFMDAAARSLLLDGKHLILFNAIEDFQSSLELIPEQPDWLNAVETDLGARGLLERNPARAAAAIAGSARQFFKAEKQLWRVLELIRPKGARVYHKGRGLIFNWARITDLIR
ncbi:hypothetical protein H5407_16475 [Mitsuaria sp. WAJ17]|uniref:hypothetical protein n=1 Tax=Mitsuaria sp. WAJ17 TaxID=2761452 RepID=UPI001601B8B9|nr:hypothetical protein [Mitsuaria sp. WAJ17]MBB2486824.1 hypothetical protein [Mitsuaria sp. WAJ17]